MVWDSAEVAKTRAGVSGPAAWAAAVSWRTVKMAARAGSSLALPPGHRSTLTPCKAAACANSTTTVSETHCIALRFTK